MLNEPTFSTNDIVEEMLFKFKLPIKNQILIYRAQYRIQASIKKGLLIPIEIKTKNKKNFRFKKDDVEEFIKHIRFINGSFVFCDEVNLSNDLNVIEEVYELVEKHKMGKITDEEFMSYIYK